MVLKVKIKLAKIGKKQKAKSKPNSKYLTLSESEKNTLGMFRIAQIESYPQEYTSLS